MPQKVKALLIKQWSDQDKAKSTLPVLLRKLINSTASPDSIKKIDFPAYENSQTPGFDGEVEFIYVESSSAATSKIPSGKSVWELGTGNDPKKKADEDYTKRTEKIPEEERKKTTFIFVTPRNWQGKKTWQDKKQKENKWKEIIVYDASDLEQWLEQSPQATTWFLEENDQHDTQIQTLDEYWKIWCNTLPKLNKTLFKQQVTKHQESFSNWLNNKATAKKFVIVADSCDEGLAFLTCLFDEVPKDISDTALIVKSTEALRKLRYAQYKGIVIIDSSCEQENISSDFSDSVSMIIISDEPTDDKSDIKPDIKLDRPSDHDFYCALKEMKINPDKINSYIEYCAFSPTRLRRLLSPFPEVKNPKWSKHEDICRKLIPITLAGSFVKTNNKHREIIKKLFDTTKYHDVEKAIRFLVNQDKTLLFEKRHTTGVKSQTEKLFLIQKYITESDLNIFYEVAKEVLNFNQNDPLHQGICDSLILLSIHGNQWFEKSFINNNIQAKVDKIIKNLLETFKKDVWSSIYLQKYAEAAPEIFLERVEKYLDNAVLSSFKDIAEKLLWSLEVLAWNENILDRVVKILTFLVQNTDESIKKPIDSLINIFGFWIPQTSANSEKRQEILNNLMLCDKTKFIGFKICINLFNNDNPNYSAKPKYRAYSTQHVEVQKLENPDFISYAKQQIFAYNNHDEKSLIMLVEAMAKSSFNNEDCEKIWEKIFTWISNNQSDSSKAELREVIRLHFFSLDDKKAKEAYEKLEPKDLLWKNRWLFAKDEFGIEEWPFANELYKTGQEYQEMHEKIKEKIKEHQKTAISEIWQKQNIDGIIEFLKLCNNCFGIGLLVREIIDQDKIIPLFDKLFLTEKIKIDNFLNGFFNEDKKKKDLSLANSLIFHYNKLQQTDNANKINNIIEFNLINYPSHDVKKTDSRTLMGLLEISIKKIESLKNNNYHKNYLIRFIFNKLSYRDDVSKDELAILELLYIDILQDSGLVSSNLQQYIINNPQLFMLAFYHRKDNQDNFKNWLVEKLKNNGIINLITHDYLQSIADILVNKINLLLNQENKIIDENNLKNWITQVRELCKENNENKLIDEAIGSFLRKPEIKGKDEIWPCELVRNILETLQSKDIDAGFVDLKCGPFFKGGQKELALKHKKWSEELSNKHHHVSKLVKKIAENYEEEEKLFDELP
jgi:hypothetical protein